MAYIKQLIDENEVFIYPKTFAEAITDTLGRTFEDIVESIPSPSLKKVYTFTTGNWTGPSGGFYSYTISAATHGLGIDPSIDVYGLDSGSYYKVINHFCPYDVQVFVDATGNVTLKTTTTFNGKVILI